MKRSALMLPLLLAGCATLTASETQNITVLTQPEEATCTLTNNVRTWQIDRTPGSVDVTRDYSPLEVICWSKDKRGTATLESETRGRTYGNILLGGVPAIVDAQSGYGYAYESGMVLVTLTPTAKR